MLLYPYAKHLLICQICCTAVESISLDSKVWPFLHKYMLLPDLAIAIGSLIILGILIILLIVVL